MKETREILNELRPGQSIGIFIGPEGGFEEEEVSKALEQEHMPLHLEGASSEQRQQDLRFCLY